MMSTPLDRPVDDLTWCLQMLARMHDVPTTPDALLAGLPLNKHTLQPSSFISAALRIGFASRIVRKDIDKLNPALFPVILILKEERACLLQADHGDGTFDVLFPDLPEAVAQVAADDLLERYTGVAIYCRRRSPMNNAIATLSFATRQHWFWDAIRENRSIYRDILIAALFINLFTVSMPLFVMNVYDRVVPNHATDTLWVLSAGVFLVFCLDLVLRHLRTTFLDLAASRADIKVSSSIMAQILGMRMEGQSASVGSFASSVGSFETVRSFFGSIALATLIDLPFALLFLLIIGLIALPLIVPIIIGIIAVLCYALAVQRRLHALSEEVWQAGARRNGLLVESLSSMETIKSFNGESRQQAGWERMTIFLADRGARLRTLGASVGSFAQWTQHCVSVGIIIIGVYLIIDGDMSQGGLIAAYLLSSRTMAPVSQIASLLTQFFQSQNSLVSLNEVMEKPVERPPGKQWLSRPIIQGKVDLENARFHYPDTDIDILQNVSFRIKAGEHVAILGRNGSGKSSIAKLIMGLYQPTGGKILIDDANLEQIDPAELRRACGYVPQDITLVSGSLYDNITLGEPRCDAAQLTQALNIAGLGALVNSHPDGLHLQVGERGQNLSWGQRQAIALARAVLHEPSLLIFDEPTSFLDNTLEDHVLQQLRTFITGRTMVLVTHRNALLDLVDRLIVLDGGQVVADGPRQEVLDALRAGRVRRSSS